MLASARKLFVCRFFFQGRKEGKKFPPSLLVRRTYLPTISQILCYYELLLDRLDLGGVGPQEKVFLLPSFTPPSPPPPEG